MKRFVKALIVIMVAAITLSLVSLPVLAAEEDIADTVTEAPETAAEEESGETDAVSAKAIAAAVIIAVASGAGAVAMAMAVYKSVDGTSRQPEAAGSIRTTMMMGLVFIETAIIYALIVAILIIFVL
ncbi:MAG: ATP synthase F0 subunit C [Clostridia bacterium]|nr:ATP synthase F0 subunit C [Clostridia bacterium]